MIQIYILGLLIRRGPIHGYGLKQIMSNEISDFTQIKLPVIYYHLEKMEKKGYIKSVREKGTDKPDRTIYSALEKGETEFKKLLQKVLSDSSYLPSFDFDSIFYFFDSLDSTEIHESIKRQEKFLESKLESLRFHRDKMREFIPKEYSKPLLAIFSHHEVHIEAELCWIKEQEKQW